MSDPRPDRKVLLTIAEVEKILGLCHTTVYKLIGQGHLASVSIGKRRFVTRKQLREFVSGLEAEPSKINHLTYVSVTPNPPLLQSHEDQR